MIPARCLRRLSSVSDHALFIAISIILIGNVSQAQQQVVQLAVGQQIQLPIQQTQSQQVIVQQAATPSFVNVNGNVMPISAAQTALIKAVSQPPFSGASDESK